MEKGERKKGNAYAHPHRALAFIMKMSLDWEAALYPFILPKQIEILYRLVPTT